MTVISKIPSYIVEEWLKKLEEKTLMSELDWKITEGPQERIETTVSGGVLIALTKPPGKPYVLELSFGIRETKIEQELHGTDIYERMRTLIDFAHVCSSLTLEEKRGLRAIHEQLTRD